MKPLCLILACSILLSSCSWMKKHIANRGEYTPEYLKEDSPLDPPGTAEARAAARAKLLKEGAFSTGSTPEIKEGKAFLFDRNPDTTENPGGKMVNATHAKILACEGLYYFVETDSGKRGFLRESDFIDPLRLVPTNDLFGEGLLPGDETGFLPEMVNPAELGDNRQLATDQNGRTVVVTRKTSEKSDEFEARRRALESGQSMDDMDEDVPLPPPSGTGPKE